MLYSTIERYESICSDYVLFSYEWYSKFQTLTRSWISLNFWTFSNKKPGYQMNSTVHELSWLWISTFLTHTYTQEIKEKLLDCLALPLYYFRLISKQHKVKDKEWERIEKTLEEIYYVRDLLEKCFDLFKWQEITENMKRQIALNVQLTT